MTMINTGGNTGPFDANGRINSFYTGEITPEMIRQDNIARWGPTGAPPPSTTPFLPDGSRNPNHDPVRYPQSGGMMGGAAMGGAPPPSSGGGKSGGMGGGMNAGQSANPNPVNPSQAIANGNARTMSFGDWQRANPDSALGPIQETPSFYSPANQPHAGMTVPGGPSVMGSGAQPPMAPAANPPVSTGGAKPPSTATPQQLALQQQAGQLAQQHQLRAQTPNPGSTPLSDVPTFGGNNAQLPPGLAGPSSMGGGTQPQGSAGGMGGMSGGGQAVGGMSGGGGMTGQQPRNAPPPQGGYGGYYNSNSVLGITPGQTANADIYRRPVYGYGSSPGGNPFLDQTFNRAADQVQARMGASTAMQGLSNSGVQQMYNRDLNDLATGVYGGAYENDANRRLQAGLTTQGLASGALQSDANRALQAAQGTQGLYAQQGENAATRALTAGTAMSQMQQNARENDLNRMMQASQGLPGWLQSAAQYGLGLGDVYRDQRQAYNNEAIRAFEDERMHPYRMIDVLGRGVGMSMGGQGTTTTSSPGYYQPNSTAGIFGTGLGILGLLRSLGGNN